jgi:autotransporter-associated beta strand protein
MNRSSTGSLHPSLVYFTLFLLIVAPTKLFAAERDWSNTGTDFNSGSSWAGSVAPGSSDIAWFKTGKVTDPFLSSTITILGLYFGDKTGGTSSFGYHITSPDSVTHFNLDGTATSTAVNETTSAPAIGADNTSGTNTIDAQVRLDAANGSTQTFYQASGGTLVMNGTVSSSHTVKLNLNGGGTLRLTGVNSYTGGTLVSAGRLEAAANNALGNGTVGVTVNSGGTLVFTNASATNRLNDSAGVTLAGGTLARSGTGVVSEGSGSSVVNGTITGGANAAGMGALTLTASSSLDFGNDAGRGTLVFSSFVSNAHVLNVLNWISSTANKTTNTSGVDGSDDRLIFAADESANLARFNFGSGLTATEIALGGGFFEIVPISEPETREACWLALGGMTCQFIRRRRNQHAPTVKGTGRSRRAIFHYRNFQRRVTDL